MATLLASPSTLRPDAALGLLLCVRGAWCHLLSLSIGNRAPNWAQMLNGRQRMELPLPGHRVRLGLFARPPHPFCASPDAETWAGLAFARSSSTWSKRVVCKSLSARARDGEQGGGLSEVTSVSHVTLFGPQRFLLAQLYAVEFVQGTA